MRKSGTTGDTESSEGNVTNASEGIDKTVTIAGSDSTEPREFIVVTGLSPNSQPGKDVSRTIRVQAMRHYFWKRNRQGKEDDADEAPKANPAKPSEYKGRFRLNSAPQKSKVRTTSGKKGKRHAKESAPKNSALNSIGFCQSSALVPNPVVIRGGILDPFDAYSLQLRPESMALIYYYSSDFSMNFLALNMGGDPCLVRAREDQALFHSVLYLVALDYNLRRGLTDPVGCLYHSSEAFRIINNRLQDGDLSDATIAAVALIAIKENLSGMFGVSQMHMRGLRDMVEKRGGIQNIQGLNRRVIMWADFCYSSVWNCPPHFPRNTIATGQELNPHLNPESAVLAVEDIFGPDSPTVPIFKSLSRISAAMHLNGAAALDKSDASSQIYSLEYELHLLKAGCPSTPDSGSIPIEAAPLCVATHLYLYLVIRELPSRSKVIYRLVQRLRSALQLQCTEWWTRSRERQNWLLWMLFIGYGAAAGSDEVSWFLQRLRILCAILGIEETNQLQTALRAVLWQEVWCGPHCERLRTDLSLQG